MFTKPSILALVASASYVSAVTKGFNYGATNSDGSAKTEQDFANEFSTCSKLSGTTGFTSARLYTTVQPNTKDTLSGAIPAAAKAGVPVMLGVWGSGGSDVITNEISALKQAASQYPNLKCEGISVGSEDLYRNSDLGVKAKAGIGADPNVIAGYIDQVKSALSGTSLGGCPVGHVDTWTAWVNSSNNIVISKSDFIGFDAYPYYQNTMPNDISNAKDLFLDAYKQTQNAVNGKPIIVTESGWPVSGPTENQAVANVQNAQTFWNVVGCGILFDKMPTYWFTCQDALPTTPSPSFGVIGSGSTTPLYDLSCKNTTSTTSASGTATATPSGGFTTLTNSAGTPTATVSGGSGSGSSSGSGSGSGSGASSGSGSGAGNGTYSGTGSGGSGPSTAAAGGATSPTVSTAAGEKIAPMGGFFAAVLALAAAL